MLYIRFYCFCCSLICLFQGYNAIHKVALYGLHSWIIGVS